VGIQYEKIHLDRILHYKLPNCKPIYEVGPLASGRTIIATAHWSSVCPAPGLPEALYVREGMLWEMAREWR
jgi:hypothetical protein